MAMVVTITLPDKLEARLNQKAKRRHISIEKLVLEILSTVLGSDEQFPTPEEVVAKIKALPANPQNIRPAEGSLAEALRNAPDDPDFDLEAWKREWVKVEAEMKAMTRANNLAEGHG
jgi:plasmid stability protein